MKMIVKLLTVACIVSGIGLNIDASYSDVVQELVMAGDRVAQSGGDYANDPDFIEANQRYGDPALDRSLSDIERKKLRDSGMLDKAYSYHEEFMKIA